MSPPDERPSFTVSNGDLVITLNPVEGGWYAVGSPVEPHLHTQAKSIEEAFEMAYDALKALREARSKYSKAVEAAMSAG